MKRVNDLRLKAKVRRPIDWVIDHTLLEKQRRRNRWKSYVSGNKNIYIFSSPRGGSTWLSECLSAIESSSVMWEPLMPRRFPPMEMKRFGLDWHLHIPESEEWPEAYRFFRKLLNREILYSKYFWTNSSTLKAVQAERFIFKFCYGHLVLPWLIRQFSIRPIIMVRHPCAVVNSQLLRKFSSGVWSFKKPLTPFHQIYDPYAKFFSSWREPFERLAGTWAIQHRYLFDNIDVSSEDTLVIYYENLVDNFSCEMNRISAFLDIEPETFSGIDNQRGSVTRDQKQKTVSAEKQLSRWKTILTLDQQERIIEICMDVGVDMYNLDSFPATHKF